MLLRRAISKMKRAPDFNSRARLLLQQLSHISAAVQNTPHLHGVFDHDICSHVLLDFPQRMWYDSVIPSRSEAFPWQIS